MQQIALVETNRDSKNVRQSKEKKVQSKAPAPKSRKSYEDELRFSEALLDEPV